MSLLRKPSRKTEGAQSSRVTTTHLTGRWLILARVIWIVLALYVLGIFIFSLPTYFTFLYHPCTGVWCTYQGSGFLTASEIQTLPHYGLSLDAYAWSTIVINVGVALVWLGMGGILFWRKSDDWMALLVALMLISNGANTTGNLLYSPSIWRIPENGVQLIAGLTILFTLALFPNGRFVPHWAVWIALLNPASFVSYLSFQHNGLLNILITNSFSLVNLLIPISLGLAMFRYRLWDIDVIINRTLVYGILTAILALVYFGLIFALQYVLQGIIDQNNNVAIVVSTLAIYVLFQPLRHRIQRVIDRRFYRSKYDAAKIIANFSSTLRDDVDLNTLSEHLVAVVQETMQPTHVSLWLHPRIPVEKQHTSLIETPPTSSRER